MTRPAAAAGPMRLVPTAWDEVGNDVMQSVLTGKSMKVRALCLTTPDVVIPIVFVPGIMGTRLKVKGRIKDAAWFPPDGGWESLVLALRHIGRTAADRQRLLNPATTEVDDDGPAFPDDISKTLLGFAPGKTDAERIKWRGWGQLHASSYLSILSLLESSMALIFDPASRGRKLTSHWQELVMARQDAARLGAQKPFTPLQEKQLQQAAEALYPVHAVMPAIGAPATYKRIRAGFEGAGQVVGAAPKPHVVQLFKHEGKRKGHESYDHQFSYNAPISQAVTLYSIIRIVSSSKLVANAFEESGS